jgi:hypothetical protein
VSDNLATVEAACTELADTGQLVSFTAVADRTGISRTTLYRSPELRAVIDEHRHHSQDRRTLSGLGAEIAHLRTALEAVANRVRQHEERLRRLEPTRPRRKAN